MTWSLCKVVFTNCKAGLVIAVADGSVAAWPAHVGPGGGAGDGRLVPGRGVTLKQEILQILNNRYLKKRGAVFKTAQNTFNRMWRKLSVAL